MTPERAESGTERHLRFFEVLVPVDFTPASLRALRFAGAVGSRFGSHVHLLHMVEVHPFALNEGAAMYLKPDEQSAAEALGDLNRLAKQELPGLAVTPQVRQGQPAWEILQAAQSVEADLIILTAHRRSALGRALFGSLSGRVERQAPCPVLVISCEHVAENETAERYVGSEWRQPREGSQEWA